jgi:integrase
MSGVGGAMANRAVSVYESVKKGNQSRWVPVEIPPRRPNGSLYLKHNRHGDFYIRWYQGVDAKGRPRQRWKQVKGVKSLGKLPNLEHAIAAAEAKAWELQHPERVKEETPADGRLSLSAAIYGYLDEMSNNAKTVKEHRHALSEFATWTAANYVDEITRAQLLKWKDHLVKKGNDELTAVWKVIRVNKFYKTVMKLPHGSGLVKTTEFKAVLNRKPKIEVYSAEELKKFFAACDERQFVLFQLYYKCGLRNKELAHLEWADIDLTRREVIIRQKRVQDGDTKKVWGPKHGSEGKVAIPAELIPRLEKLKQGSKHSLVFPTREGRVNIKLLDQCKLVAKRAGLDESKWKIKSFRSTFATNRLRNGQYDLATIREQLRHRDQKSIESYLDYLRNEQLIQTGKVDTGWDA